MTAVARKQLPLRPAGPDTVERAARLVRQERRDLPWRVAPGKRADPYRVWLSEIMLQQTTVKAVIPFYLRFLARWPTVKALAAAPLDDVLAAWAGLGYYSRARNLHKCARSSPQRPRRQVSRDGRRAAEAARHRPLHGGRHRGHRLRRGRDAGRRQHRARRRAPVRGAPAAARRQVARLKRLAATLTPARRAGDFAQAMMDLGAGICTPRRPSCLVCPVQRDCAAHAHGIAAYAADAARTRRATAARRLRLRRVARGRPRAAAQAPRGRTARRHARGALARSGATLLPPAKEALRSAPVRADWWAVPGTVVHVFTHFRLELLVYRALVPADATLTFWAEPERCRWVARRDLHAAAAAQRHAQDHRAWVEGAVNFAHPGNREQHTQIG